MFAEFGSAVDEPTVTVSLTAVPAGVPASTVNTTGKLAVPGAKLGFVQLIVPAVPTVGVVHVQPLGTVASEKKVVFGGVLSVKAALAAALGPSVRHDLRISNVIARDHRNRAGRIRNRKVRRARHLNVDCGAVVAAVRIDRCVEETESVCVIVVPFATVPPTVTTNVKFAVVLAAIVVVSVQARARRTSIPLAQSTTQASYWLAAFHVNTGAFAVAGPLLVTLCV